MALSRAQVLAYFDRAYYLEQNPDLKAYVLSNPGFDVFEHYYNAGMNEGRVASKLFNPKIYLDKNPDLKAYAASHPGLNLLEHYITAGKNEGRKATEAPLVDDQKSGSFMVDGNCPKGSVTVACYKGSDSNYVKDTHMINGDIIYMYESSPQNQFCKSTCVSSGHFYDVYTSGNTLNMNCCDH